MGKGQGREKEMMSRASLPWVHWMRWGRRRHFSVSTSQTGQNGNDIFHFIPVPKTQK